MAKCPHCRSKELYLKRTSPMDVWGCRNCERKIKILRERGFTDKEIKALICRR